MSFKVVVLIAMVGMATSVPLPQADLFRSRPANSAAEAIDSTIPQTNFADVDPEVTAEALRSILPQLASALTDTTGSNIERMNRVALAFLPLGRSAIAAQSKSRDNYDIDRYQKQQAAAEETVPLLLDSLKIVVESFPAVDTTPINVDLSAVPQFDSPLVPNSVIRGQRIPATEFVPEIIIPDIIIQ